MQKVWFLTRALRIGVAALFVGMTIALYGAERQITEHTFYPNFKDADTPYSDTSRTQWRGDSTTGWLPHGEGACYLRYSGIGLQNTEDGSVGAMRLTTVATKIAWVEVTVCVSAKSAVSSLKEDILLVTLENTTSGATTEVELHYTFEERNKSVASSFALSGEGIGYYDQITITSAARPGVVVTVQGLRTADAAEQIQVTPNVVSTVRRTAPQIDVTLVASGGTGTFESLSYTFNAQTGSLSFGEDVALPSNVVVFSLPTPSASGVYDLDLAVYDDGGNVGTATRKIHVSAFLPVTDHMAYDLTTTGFKLYWEQPPLTPLYYDVHVRKGGATIKKTAGEVRSLDVTTFSEGLETHLLALGTREDPVTYSLNGGEAVTWNTRTNLVIPAGTAQTLTLFGVEDTEEVFFYLKPEELWFRELTVCALEVPIANGAKAPISYEIITYYDNGSDTPSKATTALTSLVLPAVTPITKVVERNGNYIPLLPDGCEEAIYEVIRETPSPSPYDKALYLTRILLDTETSTKALLLTNVSNASITLTGYTLETIHNETGTISPLTIDMSTLTLPAQSNLALVYKTALADDTTSQCVIDANAGYFFSRLYATTHVRLTRPDGSTQTLQPVDQKIVTLNAHTPSAATSSAAIDTTTFSSQWFITPAPEVTLLFSGSGTAALAGVDWTLFGGTRILLNYIALDAEGQRSAPHTTLLWEKADTPLRPGFIFRIR